MSRGVRQAIFAMGVMGLGMLLFLALRSFRTPPDKVEAAVRAPLVNGMRVTKTRKRLRIPGHGRVVAREDVTLSAEVAGRLLWRSEALVAGNLVEEGTLLARLDPVGHVAALDGARADLAREKEALLEIESDARIARTEWERFVASGMKAELDAPDPGALTLFGPQLARARARVTATEGRVAVARRNLARTRVTSPVTGRILSRMAGVGEFLQPGSALCRIIAMDALDVEVPVPERALGWLSPSGGNLATLTSRGRVWQGRVDRILPEVGEGGVPVVSIRMDPAPFRNPGMFPEVGLFVNVEILGPEVSVISVPVSALRDGNTVWVVEDGSRLRVQQVAWVFRNATELWVRSGLADGDRIVVGAFGGMVPGMRVRIRKEGEMP